MRSLFLWCYEKDKKFINHWLVKGWPNPAEPCLICQICMLPCLFLSINVKGWPNLPNVKWFDQLFSKRFSHLEQSISRSSNAKKLERDATTSHEPWVMSHESWHRQRSGCLLDYSLTYRFINDSRRDSYAEMKWMAQAIDLTNPTKPHITLFIYLF